MQKSFFARAGIYVVGNTLQRAIAYLLLPIFALILSPDEYGRYALFVSAMAIINLIFDMGLSKAASRNYVDYEEDPRRLRRFLEHLAIQRAGLTLAVGAILGLLAIPLWNFVTAGGLTWWPYLPLLLTIAAMDSFLLIVVLIHRMRNDALGFILLKLGQACAQFAFGIGIVTLTGWGAQGAALGIALGSAVSFLAATVVYYLRLIPKEESDRSLHGWGMFRANFSYGAPLLFYDLAFWLRTQADPFILIRFVGLATVGVYQLGYVSGMVMGLLVVSIDLAYAPLYYRWKRSLAEADVLHRLSSTLLTLLTASFAVIGVMLARPVLLAVLGPERALAADVAPLLIVSHFIYGHYLAGTRSLFYARRVRPITLFSITVSLSCIAITFFAVPRFGVMAAAWMNATTFSILWIGGCVITRFYAPPVVVPLKLQIGLTLGLLGLVVAEPSMLGVGAMGIVERLAISVVIVACLTLAALPKALHLRELMHRVTREV